MDLLALQGTPPPLHPPSLGVGVGDGEWQPFLTLFTLGETWCRDSSCHLLFSDWQTGSSATTMTRLQHQTLGQVVRGPLQNLLSCLQLALERSLSLNLITWEETRLPFLLQTSLPHSVFPERALSSALFLFSHSVVSDSFVTPWTIACQAPLSMEFPRQEYWSALPFPSPGDLPNARIKPMSPALEVNSLPLSHQ